jgi:putative membrane protein insertion efficiency factor
MTDSISRALSRGAAMALLAVLRLYQLVVSPWIGPSCRFAPSCSEYTRQAVVRYGVLGGLRRGAARLLRCHPWHPGGWDPVR